MSVKENEGRWMMKQFLVYQAHDVTEWRTLVHLRVGKILVRASSDQGGP
jgi:hypothetical protein